MTTATSRKPKVEANAPVKEAPRRVAAVSGGRREENAIELCEGLIDIVAALFNVPSKELRRTGRTGLDIARVRQIAMYVGHVVMRLSMYDIGKGFARDRTTVMYACHTIEDLRDVEEFDGVVAMVERVVLAAFRDRLGL
ncbi:helix-turn-helix domain-containing protein [Pseudaminobacter soli (ex Li et al. 2025)]|uniref:helix-turn-helix domain-containing protein n=1 Tax=Pseudaminobacter soli (ex Li et al. 2025) TaxID=1295366 RepID=UPI001FDEA936|nr:helix-turn-helix domain-containing protein [Mesorhizobium soli]